MSQSHSRKMSQSERRAFIRFLRINFAAWHFLHTSKDGAVIARILGVKPIDLYRWSEKEEWIEAIHRWSPGFKGSVDLEGEYFKSVVGDSIVERSLKHASRLWNALFEGRQTRKLQETLDRFEEIGFTE